MYITASAPVYNTVSDISLCTFSSVHLSHDASGVFTETATAFAPGDNTLRRQRGMSLSSLPFRS